MTTLRSLTCVVCIFVYLVEAFQYNFAFRVNRLIRWSDTKITMIYDINDINNIKSPIKNRHWLSMSDSDKSNTPEIHTTIPTAPSSSSLFSSGKKTNAIMDISQYAIGQEYTGTLMAGR